MSILPASSIGDESTGFYNGVATQSLRFDDGSSDHLTFTPGSASSAADRRKITHAVWIKRGNIGTYQSIYSSTKSGGGDYYLWRFNNDDTMTIFLDVDDSNFAYDGTEVYRDTMNWYHFVLIIDTTQSSASNRIKLYANGVQQTLSNKYGSDVSQNFETYVMDGTEDAIGEFNFNSTTYFDGYMCDFITTIGQSNSISDFGETKNGVWIAKNYSGSYGANGFRLEFKQTGTGTASTSTIGADTSGNTNHWTSNNLASADSNFPDSPENNFATFNPLEVAHTYEANLSEGNLIATPSDGGNWNTRVGTFNVSSGKWYAEFATVSSHTGVFVGILKTGSTDAFYIGYGSGGWGYYDDVGNVQHSASVVTGTSYGGFVTDDVIGVALNLDDNELRFYKNGSVLGSSAISIDANESYAFAMSNTQSGHEVGVNFGQDSTFAGNITSGSDNATDDNGQGDFYDAPPSGFLAMCSANLPDTALAPNQNEQADDHFNTFLYTGDGTSDRNIALNTFTPDWSWNKGRSQVTNNTLIDTSRRNGDNFPNLHSNTNDAEANDTHPNIITNGIQVSGGLDNNDGTTFVVWTWKANGGTTSSNTDGTITSTVQANTTAGFSIVTATAPSGTFSFGHGLGVAPDMFWFKERGQAGNWIIYHKDKTTSIPSNVGVYLNNNLAGFASGSNWLQTVSSSVISMTTGQINSTGDFVCYCFNEIEGYSKFGSYQPNGSTDGTYIHLGFSPSFFMAKSITASGYEWVIIDNKRTPFNEIKGYLVANEPSSESTSYNFVDFLSNGIKIRASSGNDVNASGHTVIYMAFADQPFKFSNAR